MGSKEESTDVVVPIVFGSRAVWLGSTVSVGGFSHKWSIYVCGLDGEDLSWCVKSVVFQLHPSCEDPLVIKESPPYQVDQGGWGEFEAIVRINFKRPEASPVDLYHLLRLYPPGQALEARTTEPVVSESYDEIVFRGCSPSVRDALFAASTRAKAKKATPPPAHAISKPLSTFSETDELTKLAKAHDFVRGELSSLQARLAMVETHMLEEGISDDVVAAAANNGSSDAMGEGAAAEEKTA